MGAGGVPKGTRVPQPRGDVTQSPSFGVGPLPGCWRPPRDGRDTHGCWGSTRDTRDTRGCWGTPRGQLWVLAVTQGYPRCPMGAGGPPGMQRTPEVAGSHPGDTQGCWGTPKGYRGQPWLLRDTQGQGQMLGVTQGYSRCPMGAGGTPRMQGTPGGAGSHPGDTRGCWGSSRRHPWVLGAPQGRRGHLWVLEETGGTGVTCGHRKHPWVLGVTQETSMGAGGPSGDTGDTRGCWGSPRGHRGHPLVPGVSQGTPVGAGGLPGDTGHPWVPGDARDT